MTEYPPGGGEMDRLIQQFDWQKTTLGTPEQWPVSLRVTLSTILHSPFPMLLFWGEELVCFYNDAFRPSLGENGKHPGILGKRGEEAWPDTWEFVGPLIKRALYKGESSLYEDRLVPITRNGKLENVFWTFSYSPVRDERGDIAGVLVVCTETTKKVTKFHNIVEQTKSPVVILKGEDLIVEEANQAALHLWRVGREAIGKPFVEVLPEMQDQVFVNLLQNVLRTGIPYKGFEEPAYFHRANGSTETIYFNFEYTPFREANGDISGVIVLATDVTQQVVAKQQLHVAEEEMRMAVEAAELGYWNLDPLTNTFKCNQKTRTLFGLPFTENINLAFVLEVIHPEDKEQVVNAIKTALTFESGGHYDIEYRVVHPQNNQLQHIRAIGQAYFNEQKTAYRFSGTVLDINKRKEAEKALLDSEERFRIATTSARIGTWSYDIAADKVYASDQYKKLFGLSPEKEMTYELFVKAVAEEDRAITDKVNRDVIEMKNGVSDYEWEYRIRGLEDGNLRWLKARGKVYTDTDGKPARFAGAVMDITKEKEAEETLRYRKALLEAQSNAIPDGLLIVDTKGKILSYNNRFAEIWRVSRKIMEANDDTTALSFAMRQVADPETFINRVNYLYENARESTKEEIILKDSRILERYGKAVIGEDGTFFGWAWYFHDVTDERKAVEALRQSEARFRNLIEEAPMATCLMTGRDMTVELVNDVMLGYWGKDRSVIGKPLAEALPELEGQPFLQILDDVFTTGKTFEAVNTPAQLEVNGVLDTYYFNFTYKPLFNNQGQVYGIINMAIDVTAEVKARKNLEESELRFRTIADTAPAFIFIGNKNAEIEYVNRSWIQFTGLSDEEAKGRGWATITHPDDLQLNFDTYNRAFETRISYQFESRQRSAADDTYHTILWKGVPRFLPDGEFLGILGIGFDISDRKKAEAALKESNNRFELVAKATRDAIWDWDLTTDNIWWNEGLCTLFGYKVEEIEPGIESWYNRVHPDDKERIISGIHEVIGTGRKMWADEYRFRRADGTYAVVFDRGYLLHNDEGKPCRMLGSMQDITERKEFELTLKANEQRFRTIFETVPVSVWEEDFSAVMPELNRLHKTYGDQLEDYLTANPDQVTFLQALVRVRDTNKASLRMFEANSKEELLQGLHVVFAEETLPVFRNELLAIVNRKRIFESEYVLRTIKGRKIYTLVSITFPESGDFSSVLVSRHDITERRRAEVELEALVQQRTKELQRSNEDLQQFAHVASHDLKEPVRKIRTFAGRLIGDKGTQLSENGQAYLHKIEQSAQRMYDMIDGVLTYSTLSATQEEPQRVELNDVINNIEGDLEVVIQQKNACITHDDLPAVQGAPVLLHQLFYNLVNNSLKFARPNVPPRIEIRSGVVQHQNRPFAQIRVKDNGIGFEQEYASRIFETFTRLNAKDKYEGTGLGLSLCKKIVERHGGTIKATGSPGEGAEITLLLPLAM